MTFTPKAEDFEVYWDADHLFHFFESEDGDIFAYGHADPEEIVSEVQEYDRLSGGPDEDYAPLLTQVRHTWALVTSGSVDDDWRFGYGDKYKDAEGSFPLTVITR